MSTGTADQAVIEFSDLDGFYAARGGERPPEFDYGCHNVDDLAVNPVDPRPQPSWLRYRVSYVGQTGDFYAIALVGGLTAEGRVILLGSLGAGHVEKDVYAHFADWAEGEGLGRPLSWFIERIATFVPKPKADSPLSPGVVRSSRTSRASTRPAAAGSQGSRTTARFNRNDLGVDLQAECCPCRRSGLVFVPFGEPDYRISLRPRHRRLLRRGEQVRQYCAGLAARLGRAGDGAGESRRAPRRLGPGRRTWQAVQLVRGAHRVVPWQLGRTTDGSD